jgi:hypothetical protein
VCFIRSLSHETTAHVFPSPSSPNAAWNSRLPSHPCHHPSSDLPMRKQNIGKVLLMCRLWGIPFSTAEVGDKARDRRRLLWWQPALCAAATGVLFWIFGTGALEASVLTWCAIAGYGYYQYRMRYSLPTIAEQFAFTGSQRESTTAATK